VTDGGRLTPGMPNRSDPVPDVAYYATGAIQSRGRTLDGERHGALAFFRKDGSVMRAGSRRSQGTLILLGYPTPR